MALHPLFPTSPYQPLSPPHRWFPADEALRDQSYEKLLPPLVAKLREEIHDWRATKYTGASATTKALLTHWFETEHLLENADGTFSPFRYYFAQREAVETAIWLHEVRQARDKFDLLRFDASGSVSHGMFPENWPRYVLKLATGAGKTKVISLLIAWCYFHKLYEADSALARNFLLIAPNIIVLDRLRADFDGLKIFFNDPILPENGTAGRDWRDDFQLTHHIHDERMAWFQNIEDIHHKMIQREGKLALQIDVTATPKHNNGSIFVQTVSDYPLVEAIHQNVVKHPILPDAASRAKLREHKSVMFHEKYDDYLKLGVEEWRMSRDEHTKLGKKAVLFVMVDDTKNCDDVGAHLEKICPELEGKVLVIHTKHNGDISEASSGKNKEELELLRKQSNEIDSWSSSYQAIVSVLMLKEGWDVRNVTVICGLRAYAAKSNILPEQTLGRGLRRMYFGSDVKETVSVLGTPAFMDFVESIQSEGVTFERVAMGEGTERKDSLIVEVETDNPEKNPDQLDIPLPKLSRRYVREFKDLNALDPATFGNKRLPLKAFTEEETREIIFKKMLDSEIDHTIHLDSAGKADWRSVVAFFARQLLKELRLVGGYEFLYPAVRDFIKCHLFEPQMDADKRRLNGINDSSSSDSISVHPRSSAVEDSSAVDLEDPVILRNLSEPAAGKLLFDTFKAAINALTIRDEGTSRIEDRISLKHTRPFRTEARPFVSSEKSIFNRTVGEVHGGGLELDFARFLHDADDCQAFAKNYLAVGFRLDYVKADGDLSTYTPDFIVRDTSGTVWIIETKGREELDIPQKLKRLKQWCEDATAAEKEEGGLGIRYDFLYVDEDGFRKHQPKTLADLATSFTEYKQPC